MGAYLTWRDLKAKTEHSIFEKYKYESEFAEHG